VTDLGEWLVKVMSIKEAFSSELSTV